MWNKEKHKAKMKPFVDKLVSHFQSKGINFSPTDGELENVVFTSKDKEVKISHYSFYRYSGISCIYKDVKEKNTIQSIAGHSSTKTTEIYTHVSTNTLSKIILPI